MSQREIPIGMREATKDEFYSALYKDGRDIMPSNEFPDHTLWKLKNGGVWGWSVPGWRNVGTEPERYAVRAGVI